MSSEQQAPGCGCIRAGDAVTELCAEGLRLLGLIRQCESQSEYWKLAVAKLRAHEDAVPPTAD